MRRSRIELIFKAIVDVRALAAVSRFAGTDEGRPYLKGVRVEIGPRDVVYVRTDGRRLIALRQEKLRDEDPNELAGAFTIPIVHCRAFKLKKDDDGTADLFGDEERLTLKKGDVELTFTPIEGGDFVGRWVDWRHVIPRGPMAREAGQFDQAQMATFQKFADEMSGGFYPFVAHNGRDGGALIRFHHIDAIGVLMPVRIDDQRTAPLPSWAMTADPFSWSSRSSSTSEHDEQRQADMWDQGADASSGTAQQGEPAQDLGSQAQDIVDRLQEDQRQNGTDAGDDLAAGHQAAALDETDDADVQEALSAHQQENVDRLQDIQQLQPDEGEPIKETEGDDGGDGAAPKAAKPKRRARRTAEQRTADNARAAEAGRLA